jgi:hypothetical protein
MAKRGQGDPQEALAVVLPGQPKVDLLLLAKRRGVGRLEQQHGRHRPPGQVIVSAGELAVQQGLQPLKLPVQASVEDLQRLGPLGGLIDRRRRHARLALGDRSCHDGPLFGVGAGRDRHRRRPQLPVHFPGQAQQMLRAQRPQRFQPGSGRQPALDLSRCRHTPQPENDDGETAIEGQLQLALDLGGLVCLVGEDDHQDATGLQGGLVGRALRCRQRLRTAAEIPRRRRRPRRQPAAELLPGEEVADLLGRLPIAVGVADEDVVTHVSAFHEYHQPRAMISPQVSIVIDQTSQPRFQKKGM